MNATPHVTRRLVRLRRSTLARDQHLIAVTGSLGKTTAVRCIRAAVGLGESAPVEASFNIARSIPFVLLPQSPWRRFAVAEMGLSRPGSIGRLMRLLRPRTVVMTSIGTDHQELGFADLEAIRDEKAVAIRMLPPEGVAILNADQPEVASMAPETRARVVTFGLDAVADVRAVNVTMDWPRGTRFDLQVAEDVWPVRIRLLGRVGVYSALTALAVAHAHGLPMAATIERLSLLRATKRRNEVILRSDGGATLVDDSKASPESLPVLAELARDATVSGRRVFLVGRIHPPEGGPESEYRMFAQLLASVADSVVVCGDEDVHATYRRAFEGIGPVPVYAHNTTEATSLLRAELKPGDALFIKATGAVRLGRVAFALAGRNVVCDRATCDYKGLYCHTCPLLCHR